MHNLTAAVGVAREVKEQDGQMQELERRMYSNSGRAWKQATINNCVLLFKAQKTNTRHIRNVRQMPANEAKNEAAANSEMNNVYSDGS